jgi:CRP-like cAMP-binding protein
MPPIDSSEGKIWYLKRITLFEDQSDSLYHSLESKLVPIRFRKGEALPIVTTGGEKNIYALISGQVKLRSTTADGKEIIIDVLGEEDVFGAIEEALFKRGRSGMKEDVPAEAVAMSDGEAYKLRADYFQDLVNKRPTVMVSLARFLGLRQRTLEIRLTRLLYRSSLGKLAGLLSELAERYGTKDSQGIVLSIKLTHQDLASIIGTKRDTVSRGLAELELDGYIRYQRNRMTILQPEKLDEIP